MEDSYSVDYSNNSSGFSSVAIELENFLEPSPADPISRRGAEGVLRIDPGISPPVSIMIDSNSGSIERSTAL